jgi:DNA topoisomerase-1
LPREKVVAAVVRLLEGTHIRLGNPDYAVENQSFGLSTMRNRHVAVRGQRLEFRFWGKSGKFHQVNFTNQRLARIVKRCQDLPGYDLFQYLDDTAQIHQLSSEDVNNYLHAIAGEEFSAKDFRTWAGTVRAAQILQRAATSAAASTDNWLDTSHPSRDKPRWPSPALPAWRISPGGHREICRGKTFV